MDRCPYCLEFLTHCPRCGESFCPSCQMTEDELILEVEGEELD